MLDKQLVTIPFAQGLDTKSDPKQVAPGKLLELKDGVFTRPGEVSKRSGFELLSTTVDGGGAISAGAALSTHGGELLLFDGRRVYSRIAATERWTDRGDAVSVIPGVRQVRRTHTTQQLAPDVAILGGLEVTAWEDSAGGGAVRYSVVDHATGAVIVDGGLVAGGVAQRPKVLAFGGRIVILYKAANVLSARRIIPANPSTLGAAVTLLSDGFTTEPFTYDACVIGERLFVGYLSSTSTQSIRIRSFDTDLANAGAVTVDSAAANVFVALTEQCVSVCGAADSSVWIAWGPGDAVRVAHYTYNLSVMLASQQVEAVRASTVAGVESATPGTLLLAYQAHHATPSRHRIRLQTVTSGGAVAHVGTLRSVGLWSKPWSIGSDRYVLAAHASTLQASYFIVRLDSAFAIVGRLSYGTGGGLRTRNMLSEAVVDSGVVTVATSERGKILSESNEILTLLGVATRTLDFAHSSGFTGAAHGGVHYFAGAALQAYDSVSVVEAGFHLYPELTQADIASSGSDGFLGTGQYQYVVVYEWTYNGGLIERSTASVPVTISPAATEHVTLTIPTLRLTSKRSPRAEVSIAVYRTAEDGTVFHRVSDILAPLVNDPTNDTVTFTDTASDNDIAANELLYTTGDILDNAPPPACSLVSTYGGRVILAGLEDSSSIAYSKRRGDVSAQAITPAEFAFEFTIPLDAAGGPITALGALDDKLVIFKAGAVFAIAGEGPNDAGGGDLFSSPQLVTADAGCIEPNSVVTSPAGLFFRSAKGIYLLDRELSVTYIGAPVERYNDHAITGAVLLAAQNLVVFTTADGPALVFDYNVGQWCTWTRHQSVDADAYGDGLVTLKANGAVRQQTPGVFTDGGAPIKLSWTSGWISLAGLNGSERLYRLYLLGSFRSPHTLKVEFGFDYNESFTESATIDATEASSVWGGDAFWGESSPWGGEWIPYEFRVDPKTRRCTAFRVRVSDSVEAPFGGGYSISAMSADVGVHKGGARLRAARVKGAA